MSNHIYAQVEEKYGRVAITDTDTEIREILDSFLQHYNPGKEVVFVNYSKNLVEKCVRNYFIDFHRFQERKDQAYIDLSAPRKAALKAAFMSKSIVKTHPIYFIDDDVALKDSLLEEDFSNLLYINEFFAVEYAAALLGMKFSQEFHRKVYSEFKRGKFNASQFCLLFEIATGCYQAESKGRRGNGK